MARAFAIALTIAACSSGSDKPAPKAVPPLIDAAVIDGITSFGSADPNAHVDDDPTASPSRATTKRPSRPIEIFLRSTPPGAMASVDGLQVGRTPTYWVGETGAEHEFTFSYPKHALARYRFFPVATGVLHARLDPVGNDIDAGVPPAGLVQPPLIPPPETLVAPVPQMPDAAPMAPAPISVDAMPSPSDAAANPTIGPPQ